MNKLISKDTLVFLMASAPPLKLGKLAIKDMWLI